MRNVGPALLALACWWLTDARAQETEEQASPDLAFLEYLGAWAEDDDEWLAIEEWEKGAQPDEDSEGSEQEKDEDDEGE